MIYYPDDVLRQVEGKNFTQEVQKIISFAIKISAKNRISLSIDCIIYSVLKYYQGLFHDISNMCDLDSYYSVITKSKDGIFQRKNNNGNQGVSDDVWCFFSALPKGGVKTVSYLLWHLISDENLTIYDKKPHLVNLSNYSSIRELIKFEYYKEGIFKYLNVKEEIFSIFNSAYLISVTKQINFNIDLLVLAILQYYFNQDANHPIIKICSAYEFEAIICRKYISKQSTEKFNITIMEDIEFIFYFLNSKITVDDLFEKILNSYMEPAVRKSVLINLHVYSFLQDEIENIKLENSKQFNEKNSSYQLELKVNGCKDLTYVAYTKGFDKVIGREAELSRIKRVLCKRMKNNPLLIGNPGVGKTQLIKALAEEFVYNNVPALLRNTKILSLSVSEMISGTKYRGMLEENLSELLKICRDNRVIIFIDEIHSICKSSSDSENLADMIKPYLLDSDLTIIGATTIEDYTFLENDPALERRFDLVRIEEPNIYKAIEILEKSKSHYEKRFEISISEEVIEATVLLSDRYIQISSLPDKAFDVLDEACAMIKIEYPHVNTLEVEHICKIITEKTGIPTSHLQADEKEKLSSLDQKLSQRIIGQNHAISAVVNALKKARLGLNNPNKPIASFLFAGTTGVGKTETANILAEEFFGSKDLLIRIDMSEYQTLESVQKFIGAAPGYVGYSEGGQLTKAVKHKPYSVVLFDEIEKAHSDVLNILLQILDAGILKDSKGRMVSFKNTIIILTTNLGSNAFQKSPVGFNENSVSKYESLDAINDIKKYLRPELFNRIDEVIVFNTLDITCCETILKNIVAKFTNTLNNKGIKLEVSANAMKYIAKCGYNSKYGARELQRVFEKEVVAPIAQMLITEDDIRNIYIDVKQDALRIQSNIEAVVVA